MKNKKERVDVRYPAGHLEKLKNLFNTNKETDKAKEEKKRLKVFTQICNMNSSKKKVDDKIKTLGKEQSKERQTENANRAVDDLVTSSLSKERKHKV